MVMKQILKLHQTVFYGLPGLPLAMLGLPLFVYLPSYYSQNLGLSLSAVGLALLFARSFDVITDPIIGLLNDRYPKFKSVMWRRKAFILIGVPILIVGLNFLLRPNETASAFYLFIWSFVTYLGWTLINIPWLAMGAEISSDYHDKSVLASSREVFSVIGTVAVISLPVILSIQLDLGLTLETLANILTILLPLSLVPLLWKLQYNNTSEMSEATEISLNDETTNKRFTLFDKKLLDGIKHPAIKKLLPAYFVNSIANALPATLFILYVSYVLQTPDKVGILLITYFVSAIVGIPLWLFLARKTDKHISWCIALLGSILSFMFVPFIGEGDFLPFLIVCLGTGFCLGADVVMPASIQADLAQELSDNNKLSNKKNNKENQNLTALLFGIWGLLTKLSLALAIGISFPVLDFLGLNTNSTEAQAISNSAIIALVFMYALVPIVLKIWVLFNMWNFSFDKSFFTASSTLDALDDLNTSQTNKGNINEFTQESGNLNPISLSSSVKRVQ